MSKTLQTPGSSDGQMTGLQTAKRMNYFLMFCVRKAYNILKVIKSVWKGTKANVEIKYQEINT